MRILTTILTLLLLTTSVNAQIVSIGKCTTQTQDVLGCTNICATNYDPTANTSDNSCVFEEEPSTECWESATLNTTTCEWEISGEQPTISVVDDGTRICVIVSESTAIVSLPTFTVSPTVPPQMTGDFEVCYSISDLTNDTNYAFTVDYGGCDLTGEYLTGECLNVITPIPFEYVTDTISGEVDSIMAILGFQGGTPPYNFLFEAGLMEGCYSLEGDASHIAQKFTITDSQGCQCSIVFALVPSNYQSFFTECPFDNSEEALVLFEQIEEWSGLFGYGSNTQISNVPYLEINWNPARDSITSVSTECGLSSEPCPNTITEGFVNELTYEVLVGFATSAAYPIDYEITQLSGCNDPLVTFYGTTTTAGTVALSVPTTSCSNGQWQVTATDTNGCEDDITFTVTDFEDNVPCIDFDVDVEVDAATCLVTMTATGGTQPYDWSQVQADFPNVNINTTGDVATFNQCGINGGVGAGTTDSNITDVNDCVKAIRVNYDTNLSCCVNADILCLSCENACSSPVYEIDEFPGSAFHSTLGNSGDGQGCVLYGFATPEVIASGDSYTQCHTYEANTTSASFPTYINSANSSCWDNTITIYNEDCTISSATITSQGTVLRAEDLIAGQTYNYCIEWENTCATEQDIYETCSTVSESAYCDSSVSLNTITVNSGDPITLPLGTCVFDPDIPNSGYIALYYTSGGVYQSTFPSGLDFSDISGDNSIQVIDCDTNAANGAGCSDVVLTPIINNTGQPMTIGIGLMNTDVTACVVLSSLINCPIYTTTIVVLP